MSSDNAVISYVDDTDDDLMVARYNGTGWDIEMIDSGGRIANETSLVIDGNDVAHISYHDSQNQALMYASADITQVGVIPEVSSLIMILISFFPVLLQRKRC